MARNHFPPHYAENITEQNLPAELIPQFTTVEYELPTPASGPPVFLFVVDTCLDEEELSCLRDALQQTLNLLPEDSLVGLITFGNLVHVHELGFTECPKSYVFRGDKEYLPQKVQDMLGIAPTRGGHPAMPMGGPGMPPGGPHISKQSALGRFLMPVSECTFSLEQVLEDLQKDPWPTQTDERVARHTGKPSPLSVFNLYSHVLTSDAYRLIFVGTAISVALGLLESTVSRQGSRIMLFISGPPTAGPGMIVGRSKKDNIRSHTDLQKNQAPLNKPATEFFKALSERAIASSVVVDFFACSLDQVGALEIKVLISRTGGLVVLADKFSQSVFRESLRRIFERQVDRQTGQPTNQLQMGFGGQIEVIHSKEFKVAGAIGPCASLKKGGPSVADTEVGIG